MSVKKMTDNFNSKQQKIFEGLRSIGEEIAGFYMDAVNILNSEHSNGSCFLAHAAREISSGLNDVLAIDVDSGKSEKEFCAQCNRHVSIIRENRHKQSILYSLGGEGFETLIEDWFSIAKKFPEYAHRHGAWKKARPVEEFAPIWEQFENNVLERLVGSYFAWIERIDHIRTRKNKLEKSVVHVMRNILSVPTFCAYFFGVEKSIEWFKPLNKNGYFSPSKITDNVLVYLKCISRQVSENFQYSEHARELIKIINDIVQFSSNNKRIDNVLIWRDCLEILNNIPFSIIKEKLKPDEFRSWISVCIDSPRDSSIVLDFINKEFLSKFLRDEAEIDGKYLYAEIIIDVITRVKSVNKKELWKDSDIVLMGDSFGIQDIFGKYSKLIGEKCSTQVIYDIANKLKKALEFVSKDKSVVLKNANQEVYCIKVTRIFHQSGARVGGVDFEDNSYECTVQKFLPNQLEDIDMNYLVPLNSVDPRGEQKTFTFPAAKCDDFVEKISLEIKKDLPEVLSIKNFAWLMEYVFNSFYYDHLYIWFKSLKNADSGKYGASTIGGELVLTLILRNILLAKCEFNSQEGETVLRAFLSDKYQFPIFKRLVLLCIDKFWEHYAKLFVGLFEFSPNVLWEETFENELYDVLRNHNESFTQKQVEAIKRFVKEAPSHQLKGEKDDNLKHQRQYQRQYRLLSPLQNNQNFSDWYKEIKQKAAPEGDPYEPAKSCTTTRWGVGNSPLARDDILKMSVADLVNYLKNFQEDPGAFFSEKPTKEGLVGTIREAVRDEPQKFAGDLIVFADVAGIYRRALLHGLNDAWVANKEMDWQNIFNFAKKYFQLDAAKQQNGEIKKEIKIVADLIRAGCRNDKDKRAVDVEYFDEAEQIFGLIFDLLKDNTQKSLEDDSDALTYAINTEFGHVVEAYIDFSLRVARGKMNRVENWGQKKYERLLSIGTEAYILLGVYLPQIKYLDESYAVEKIKFFTKNCRSFEWKLFMEGYFGRSEIYKDLRILMRENYFKALEYENWPSTVDEVLVQHVCICYLYDEDSLEEKNHDGQDSLFWKMLAKAREAGKTKRWLDTANYFWQIVPRRTDYANSKETEEAEKVKGKILKFWEWSFKNQNTVQVYCDSDYDAFLGVMVRLVVMFEKIDEEKAHWTKSSMRRLKMEHMGDIELFVKELMEPPYNGSLKWIAEIFMEILKRRCFPVWTCKSQIQQFVDNLYNNKECRELANEICNTYGSNGFDFLRGLWGKYNPG